MTDQEHYEMLEKKEQEIRAAKVALRQKMEMAEYKKFYDACMENGITLVDLKYYPEAMAFQACAMMLPVKTDDGKVLTAFEYVRRSKDYQEMMDEMEDKFTIN